ncbi:hypothetical protein [Aequorivita capsosiphonis]|uniref:hypothetical protein n=1 Tax=Aequorivita capsosiphonis TaxID=487317 RepID=UPI0004247EE1|nr:hypothetical protein [Aequorivita capsosiphonis]
MIQIVSQYANYIKELPQLLKNSPYKAAYIIDKLQIPKATYYRKLKENNFTVKEVSTLTYILFPEDAHISEMDESLADSREKIKKGKKTEYENLMERITNVVN